MRTHNQGGEQVVVQAPHASLVFFDRSKSADISRFDQTTMYQSVQPKTLLKIGAFLCHESLTTVSGE